MKIIKIILIIIGAAVMADGIAGCIATNFNIGFIAELLTGAVCLTAGVFWRSCAVWLRTALLSGLALILCACMAVCLYGSRDSADYSEDVLIVLGAAVNGETPSAALVNRLDTAVEYLSKNTDAYVVVTGGQGPQEDITEASAMEKYLAERGIEKIIKEEKATSTLENYKYSKEIIDARFSSAKIAVITNDFHIFRAKRLAEAVGMEVSAVHAKTPKQGIAAMYLRELLAIAKLLVFGP